MKFKHGSKFIRDDGQLIRWWMGSDVLKLSCNPYPKNSLQYYTLYANRIFDFFCKVWVDQNWVVHERLIKPLNDYGIEVDAIVPDDPQKFPGFSKIPHDGINVLYYHPTGGNQFYKDWVYCWDIIEQIIWQNPGINFICVTGRMDMAKVYPIIDLYIRPSRWDGMPRMILECQELGIPYYWDQSFEPTVEKVQEWVTIQSEQMKSQ